MKNKKNKEFLKRIKSVIDQYDKMGIILDSFLISGRQTDYFNEKEKELKIPFTESIYCSGYNGALGKEDNEFTKSTFLRTTGIKRIDE